MAPQIVPDVTLSIPIATPPSRHDGRASRRIHRAHVPRPVSALPAVALASDPRSFHAIHRILLATDLSTASAGATDQALELTRALQADLLVVSVIDPTTPFSSGPVPRMDQRRAAREHAAQALVVKGRRLGVTVAFLVWEGEPGPAIIEAAESERADLIVVGTRGRNRVERWVLGSVSDHVVRHAPCPVLIVRG
jgi:nucleotide-binding universal stress UspA family protein